MDHVTVSFRGRFYLNQDGGLFHLPLLLALRHPLCAILLFLSPVCLVTDVLLGQTEERRTGTEYGKQRKGEQGLNTANGGKENRD